MLPAIREGLGYGARARAAAHRRGHAVVGGICGGTVQLLLPAIAKDEIGVGALAAALLFGGLGLGMDLDHAVPRRSPRREPPRATSRRVLHRDLRPGMILMGLTDLYALVMAGMLIWGLGGGFVMTTQRMLLQRIRPIS